MSIRSPDLTAGDEPASRDSEAPVFDPRHEIVLLNEGGEDIEVASDEPVLRRGVIDAHVTAAGVDVSGFAYCTFAGGITLFYPAGHRLRVTDQA
jgi:hypothetical protein